MIFFFFILQTNYFFNNFIFSLTGVLMSRSKYNTKSPSENPNFVSQTVATILSKAGVIDYCLTLLKALLEYWKTYVFLCSK